MAQRLDMPRLRRSCSLEVRLLLLAQSRIVTETMKPLEMSPPRAKSATVTRRATIWDEDMFPEPPVVADCSVKVVFTLPIKVVELRLKVQAADL